MGDDKNITIFLDEKRKILARQFREELKRLLPQIQRDMSFLRQLIEKYGNKIPKEEFEHSEHSLILLADAIVYIKRDLIKEEIKK